MGLDSAMSALNTYLVGYGLTGIDANNCGINDDAVFNSIIMRDNPTERRGIIISYSGINDKTSGQPSEYGGMMFNWQVSVDIFFLMWGDVAEKKAAKDAGNAFIDEFVGAIVADTTLGGAVLDCKIVYGAPPMAYNRQEMNLYYMLSFELWIRENF